MLLKIRNGIEIVPQSCPIYLMPMSRTANKDAGFDALMGVHDLKSIVSIPDAFGFAPLRVTYERGQDAVRRSREADVNAGVPHARHSRKRRCQKPSATSKAKGALAAIREDKTRALVVNQFERHSNRIA